MLQFLRGLGAGTSASNCKAASLRDLKSPCTHTLALGAERQAGRQAGRTALRSAPLPPPRRLLQLSAALYCLLVCFSHNIRYMYIIQSCLSIKNELIGEHQLALDSLSVDTCTSPFARSYESNNPSLLRPSNNLPCPLEMVVLVSLASHRP